MKIYQVGVILYEGDSYPYKTFSNKEKAERYKAEMENKKKMDDEFSKGCDLCQLIFMEDTFKYQDNPKQLKKIAERMKKRCNSAIINIENGTKGWHMCDNEKTFDMDFCAYYLREFEVEE